MRAAALEFTVGRKASTKLKPGAVSRLAETYSAQNSGDFDAYAAR